MRQRAGTVSWVLMLCTVTTVVVGAFVIGTSTPAAACSCASFADEEALEAADAAFTGMLGEVISPSGDTYGSGDPERFVFEVDEVFKGDVFARQSVVTAQGGASCGLELSGPGPFLVFTRKSDSFIGGAADGELYSSLCSGTRPLVSDAIPASFGSAASPIEGASPIGGSGNESSVVEIAAIAGVLAVVGAGLAFVIHRRTRRSAS